MSNWLPLPGRIALSWTLAGLLGWMCASGAPAGAQPDDPDVEKPDAEEDEGPPPPLYLQEQYDEIELTDGSVVKVRPIDYPRPGAIERPKKKSAKLEVRLFDPGDEPVRYEVLWTDIEKIRRFVDIVLAKANELVEEKRFDEAYDFFDWLQSYHLDWPGVPASIDRYLMTDAERLREQDNYAFALAILTELHSRSPDFAGLSEAVGANFEELIKVDLANDDFRAARQRLRVLAGMYPKHPVRAAYQKQLVDRARVHVERAKSLRAENKLREAYAEGIQAVYIWPTDKPARQLMTEVQREFPQVIVGVNLPAGGEPRDRIADWSARRTGRLLHRSLLEFTGYGPEGGVYRFPFGRDPEKLDLDTRLVFQVRPGIAWLGDGGPFTGRDIAGTLRDMADPASPLYRVNWGEMFSSVQVRDIYEVEVEFRRGHVHPEALLDVAVARWGDPAASSAPPRLGPYSIAERSADELRFVLDDGYFARGPTQPREIVERTFPDPRQALKALRRGDIQAWDRIPPWDVPALQQDERFVVQPYAVPTVHCLLPNMKRPLPASRTFRRAVLYGINRRAILEQQLLQRKSTPGNEVATGPFATGDGPDDPAGYGRNPTIRPRPYQPRLAITLATYAVQEAKAAADRKAGVPEAPPSTGEETKPAIDLKQVAPLVLAHPPHEVARVACRAIKRQLELLGLSVTLVETPPDSPTTPPDNYDLLYAELALWEPVTDASRLLGPGGLLGECSSYLELALRQLDETSGWKGARERLWDIHRVVHEDTTIIPLWQLTDYFACHRSVSNFGRQPATLYQNIEQWKIAPWFPED